MQDYTIYNGETIKKIILNTTLEVVQQNLETGDEYIAGEHPDDQYYIKNNTFYAFPVKPDYPCNFNKITEAWDWHEQASWDELRYERDKRLRQDVDPVVTNPLRWSEMTTEKQLEYTNYRLALLNLPQNRTDPRNPTWPSKPS